jgi:hypothetical protein
MFRLIENPRDVITHSDIPPGYQAVSLDNSVYAWMNGNPEKLKSEEESPLAIRKLLTLFGSISLRAQFKVQLVYSQAVCTIA